MASAPLGARGHRASKPPSTIKSCVAATQSPHTAVGARVRRARASNATRRHRAQPPDGGWRQTQPMVWAFGRTTIP